MTERKKGKWVGYKYVKNKIVPDESDSGGLHICSNCKEFAYDDSDYGERLFPYCPFCGAEMENQEYY